MENVNANDIFPTFEFPIENILVEAPMKNIPLSTLPNFHGLTSEDPDTFLFEFDVLCRSYDYTSNAYKLNFLLSTLKGATLRWFIGLGGEFITSWDNMKEPF